MKCAHHSTYSLKMFCSESFKVLSLKQICITNLVGTEQPNDKNLRFSFQILELILPVIIFLVQLISAEQCTNRNSTRLQKAEYKLLHLIRLLIFYNLVFLHQNIYLTEGYIHTQRKLQRPQKQVNKTGTQELDCSTTVTFAKLISVVE